MFENTKFGDKEVQTVVTWIKSRDKTESEDHGLKCDNKLRIWNLLIQQGVQRHFNYLGMS
jgi:hypothetical protein